MRLAWCLVALLLASNSTMAALAPTALGNVGISLPPNASFPLSFAAPDISGARRSIGGILAGRPGLVLFVDYTCKTLCGPALVLASSALAQSGLPIDSYRLVVIGIDPKDTPEDARRMLSAQIPEAVRAAAVLLRPDSAALQVAARSAGFRYVYDKSVDQFAHPELAYAVAADGHIRRLLSPFALTTVDLKAALFAPGPGASLSDRIRLICYRFGVLSGPYTSAFEIGLKTGASLTILAFAGALLLMRRRSRGRP
jgi:protein SCO1/2